MGGECDLDGQYRGIHSSNIPWVSPGMQNDIVIMHDVSQLKQNYRLEGVVVLNFA